MKRLALLLSLAACTAAVDDFGATEQNAQPIDRMIIGEAAKYPADPGLRDRASVLDENMTERRKAAWAIVERVLAPTPITDEGGGSLPRFQTWYGVEEVLPMFDRLFNALPAADRKARAPFSAEAIDAIFPWNAARAPTRARVTQERLAARRRELQASGTSALNGSRVLMSPEYVGHVLKSYGAVTDCRDPNAATFAPCLDGEFPLAAASVKARWLPGTDPIPTFDTSPASLAEKVRSGAFGEGDGSANPAAERIYTMNTGSSTKRLVALHIATKELRDWVWITLWWSDTPDSDFGADRPASLGGPFANYKMCVVTAYEEKDHTPTWCSNPYVEVERRAANTNCIGCHQHGGTGETSLSILADPARFPDSSRKKIRSTFPTDYGFTTIGGLDIASEMRTRISAALGEL